MPWFLLDSILVRKPSSNSINGPGRVAGAWCGWRGRTGDVTVGSTWSVLFIPIIVMMLMVIMVMQVGISLRIRITPSGGVLTLQCSRSKQKSSYKFRKCNVSTTRSVVTPDATKSNIFLFY